MFFIRILVCLRLTHDEKYLYRARRFAQFMMTSRAFSEEARTPDRPYRYMIWSNIHGTNGEI